MRPKSVTERRYAARLLFQFHVDKRGRVPRRRVCERRTVLLTSKDPDDAYERFLARGRAEEWKDVLEDRVVSFEFLGVEQMIETVGEDDEVWHELVELVDPDKRLKNLIPEKASLIAFRPIEKRYSPYD